MRKHWLYALLILLIIIGAIYIINPFSLNQYCSMVCNACTMSAACTALSDCPQTMCTPPACPEGSVDKGITDIYSTCTDDNNYCYRYIYSRERVCEPTPPECAEGWFLYSTCSLSGIVECPTGEKCKVIILEGNGATTEFITNGPKNWECTENPLGHKEVTVYTCGYVAPPPTTTVVTTIPPCQSGLLSSCSLSGTASCPNGQKCIISIVEGPETGLGVTEFETIGPKTYECSENPMGHQSVDIWGICNEEIPCIKTGESGCGLLKKPCCNQYVECINGICVAPDPECNKELMKEVKYFAGFEWEDYNKDLECCLSLGGTWYDIWNFIYGQSAQEKYENKQSCEEIGYYIAGEGKHTCTFDKSKDYAYCSFPLIPGIPSLEDWMIWILVIVLLIVFVSLARRR